MAIVVEELKCPKCNAPLDIQPGKPISFCPFCGCALSVRETPDHPTETYNYNYNYDVKEKRHIIDEAAIEKAKGDGAAKTIMSIAFYMIVMMVFAVVFGVLSKLGII